MFVTVSSVAAMLVMAASPADLSDLARNAYGQCIEQNSAALLDRKADGSEFSKNFSKVCETERKAFADAVIAYERSEGSSAKEAREYANEEEEMILEDALEVYQAHLANNSRPSLTGSMAS